MPTMAATDSQLAAEVPVYRHNMTVRVPAFSPSDSGKRLTDTAQDYSDAELFSRIVRPSDAWRHRLKSARINHPMVAMKRERIPPGQHVTDGFPVLNVERPMKFDREKWRFRVTGEVDNPLELSWEQFLALPSHKIAADFHCVTGWSRLDNEWEGVLGKTICETAGVRSSAKYVVMIADSGFTSNTSIDAFLKDDTILAYRWAGKDLEAKHGGPLRSVVSSIYAYKSVKWLVGLKFAKADEPGYWEVRGYHNEADPWKEQRYSFR